MKMVTTHGLPGLNFSRNVTILYMLNLMEWVQERPGMMLQTCRLLWQIIYLVMNFGLQLVLIVLLPQATKTLPSKSGKVLRFMVVL